MNNKIFFIKNIISSLVITILLIYFAIKSPSNKVIFMPFIICAIASLLKNISIVIEKTKYINLFNTIYVIGFLLFWFGFLIYATCISLINKEYSLIIFSIPFWLVGFHLIKIQLFKNKL